MAQRYPYNFCSALLLQIVIVSPLMRTLETAAGVFGGGSATAQPLMLRQTGAPREVSAHDAIGLPSNLPFVATEMCRERMGAASALCLPPQIPHSISYKYE